MYPYRIFVSYSRGDRPLALQVVERLRALGAIPLLDTQLREGMRFTDEIKIKIAHSHLFLSVLTQRSSRSPWVHQEHGFATALGIPVLQVATEELPLGMFEDRQVLIAGPKLKHLDRLLVDHKIDDLVLAYAEDWGNAAQLTQWPQGRSLKILQHLADTACVRERDGPKTHAAANGRYRLRHSAIYSSLSLPRESPSDAIWTQSPGFPLNPYTRGLLRKERIKLEEYAREFGCDLIIGPPSSPAQHSRDEERADFFLNRRTRIAVLLEFLNSASGKRTDVAIVNERPENRIIVGDYFVALAGNARKHVGFEQTFFLRHAPSVLSFIDEFDNDFRRALDKAGTTRPRSRGVAIAALEKMLRRRR